MNKIIIILLLIPISNFSQIKIDTINNIIFLDEVKQVDGKAKEIKTKAFEWVAKSYKNSNFVTRMNTETKIITKGAFRSNKKSYLSVLTNETGIDIPYDLELSFKDDKYKIEVKNIESVDIKFSTMSKEQFKQWMLDYYSTQKGAGVAYAVKKINNEKYLNKSYRKMIEQTLPIQKEIIAEMKLLSLSLNNYISTEIDNDDW